jgi:catechol 2,3-dioxygenase-like lactoylglutathione lyase family enzyme
MSFSFSPHVAVQVTNYDQAIDYYQNVMGMEVIARNDEEAELRCGEMTFHIENSMFGHVFFEFTVEDAEQARRELEAAGCTALPTHLEGSYLVSDPFGMRYHILQEVNVDSLDKG